jgi:hypothetical protein
MIKAILYIILAYVVMKLGKIIGKKMWPEDWNY